MRNFTINRLLEVEELSGIKLVYASKKSQENIITNVNLIENPESYEWFSSGEFILTTGYFFRDDEQKQIHLIRKLHELGCSGIGIKINR